MHLILTLKYFLNSFLFNYVFNQSFTIFLFLQESIPKYKTFSLSIVIIEKPNKHKISRIDMARAMDILCGSPRPDRSRSKSQLNNIRGFAWASIVLNSGF